MIYENVTGVGSTSYCCIVSRTSHMTLPLWSRFAFDAVQQQVSWRRYDTYMNQVVECGEVWPDSHLLHVVEYCPCLQAKTVLRTRREEVVVTEQVGLDTLFLHGLAHFQRVDKSSGFGMPR